MSNEPKHKEPGSRRGLHKDWRLWVAVVLMLTAMGVYLSTLDERVVPGTKPGTPPATNQPASPAPAPR